MDNQEVARITEDLLVNRGYVFWRCESLHNEVILIVKNGCERFAARKAQELIASGRLKQMPAVYTTDEIKILCETSNMLLIHAAKKEGAVIESVESGIGVNNVSATTTR